MKSDDLFVIILMAIVFIPGFFGYQLRGQSVDYEIEEAVKQCELEKEKLQQENKEIKEDIGELLIEYYGKPIVWDVIGITKYKKGLCALKIVLKDDIPALNELSC